MCRTGGRRCPCSGGRAAARIRQRRHRGKQRLAAAYASGDQARINAAVAKYVSDVGEQPPAPDALVHPTQSTSSPSASSPSASSPSASSPSTSSPSTSSPSTLVPSPDALKGRAAVPVERAAEIGAAYQAAAAAGGRWVRLAKLRPALGGIERAELDDMLFRMSTTGFVHLAPIANRRAMTDEDRRDAVSVGGEDQHLVLIEDDYWAK